MIPTARFWRVWSLCGALLLAGGALLLWNGPRLAGTDDSALSLLHLAEGVYAAAALLVLSVLFFALRGEERMRRRIQDGLAEFERDEFGSVIRSRWKGGLEPLIAQFNRASRHLAERFASLQRQRRALGEKEQFLQTVLETIVEAVVAVDDKQRILFANRAAHAVLGLPERAVEDRPLWELVRSPELRKTVQQVLQEGGGQRVELELPRTGSIAQLAAGRLPGETPPGAVIVLHDVTELRRLETLRRDFVANVSHELKTPLTSIQAHVETLLEGAIDDASHRQQFLRQIAHAAERLQNLILDLLTLAKIESEEEVFEVKPVCVSKAVDDSLRQYAFLAQSKGLALHAAHDGSGALVLADPEALRTILNNLLDNAIHYTPPGGSVTVHSDRRGEHVRIAVSDTGIGIPRRHQDRIFERFYRVDRARSGAAGSTGLGLAIVKHLVQLCGGSVWVESEPGRGSTFTVELPAAGS